MAVTYSITVQHAMNNREGTGKSVVADLSVTGTPVAEDSGGNPFTEANLRTLGMRRIDYVRGWALYDDTAATLIPVFWHSQTIGFIFAASAGDGDPLDEETGALANAAVGRFEFIGA